MRTTPCLPRLDAHEHSWPFAPRRAALPLAVVCLAVLAAACGGGGESSRASGATGGTVIIEAPNDAQSIFPPFVGEEVGRLVEDQVFDRLAEIDSTLVTVGDKAFQPRLAKSWTWSPDSLSIAFHLDPHARWHDGQPVTAADVRYSYTVYADPKVGSPTAPLLSNVDSVSVRDSLTPVFWFKRRTPEQFYDVAYQVVVFPQHVYGSIPDAQLQTSDATRHIVGSGRFRLGQWDAGTRIELVADTANYRGRPKLDRVILTPMDPAGAATQLLTGQGDFMEAFPLDEAAKLDSSTVARPMPLATLGYTYMAFNPHVPKSATQAHPIFSDLRVRRALSEGIDRAAMAKNVFGGGIAALGHGPFNARLSMADTTIHLPPFDTVAAKAMLDSSGWRVGAGGMRAKNGKSLRFTLLIPTTSVSRRRYGVLIQEALRHLGAQVDLDLADIGTVLARQHSGDFDALLQTFLTDPSVGDTRQTWGTVGIAGGDNFLRYSNPAVDALLDSALTALDPTKAKRYASRAFQTVANDAPAVWLYDLVFLGAVNRRITVVPGRADEWWENLADWSIPPDKRIDRDRIGLPAAKP